MHWHIVLLAMLSGCSLLLDEGTSGPVDSIDAAPDALRAGDWAPWKLLGTPSFSGAFVLASDINTMSDSRCEDGFDACVISADTLNVEGLSGVSGDRPLILAARVLTVTGTLDVSAGVGKPPAGTTDCGYTAMAGAGGQGGDGETSGGLGGGAAMGEEPIDISSLQPGCRGGGPEQQGGLGGGAVQLVGFESLRVEGTILAHGQGGFGPPSNSPNGGAGGGAGGMVVLDSPAIVLASSAKVLAAGGGGSGASSLVNAGLNGKDGATGGAGAEGVQSNNGGSGGNGGKRATIPTPGGAGDVGMPGGGGGGSVGVILVNTTLEQLDGVLRAPVTNTWTSAPRVVPAP